VEQSPGQTSPLPQGSPGSVSLSRDGDPSIVRHAQSVKLRDKFVADQFGKMPPMPIPHFRRRLLGMVADRIEKFSRRWAQPAAWFASSASVAYSLVRHRVHAARRPSRRNPCNIGAVPLEGLALSMSNRRRSRVDPTGGYREPGATRIRARRADLSKDLRGDALPAASSLAS